MQPTIPVPSTCTRPLAKSSTRHQKLKGYQGETINTNVVTYRRNKKTTQFILLFSVNLGHEKLRFALIPLGSVP